METAGPFMATAFLYKQFFVTKQQQVAKTDETMHVELGICLDWSDGGVKSLSATSNSL